MRFITKSDTANDFTSHFLKNIFTADFNVYQIFYLQEDSGDGGGNGAWDLQFLVEEAGLQDQAKQTHGVNRTMYTHTTTSNGNYEAYNNAVGGAGSSSRGARIMTVINPFSRTEQTSVFSYDSSYSSSSVYSPRPGMIINRHECRVTGLGIIPEYSNGNEGTFYVYGIA